MNQQKSIPAIVVFDIDGVIRDVSGSYRRALADTVEHFTAQAYRPTADDIDRLKSEGVWNNDWEGSQELIYRYFKTQGQSPEQIKLDYNSIVDFFQSRYRGNDPNKLTGYICDEPLLLHSSYLNQLTEAGILWGFFSGATRASATYVLQERLSLKSPVLIAMEDAPGKPDPTGLFSTIELLKNGVDNINSSLPIIYVGDTVADMYTVEKARNIESNCTWIGVGVLPPHVQETEEKRANYTDSLKKAGATIVLSNVEELTPGIIQEFI